jgi:predicted nucleic acid-binding protein
LALIGEKKWLLSTWKDEKKSESGKKNNASELTAAAETAAQEQTQKWARTEDERMATKQRLAKWREERDEAVRMQHEAKKSEEERTRRLQEERSADRRRENRVRLEAWREIERSHKENMAAADEAMSAAKRATSVDPAEIRRRRARDKKIALERQKKVSQYQKELAPRAEKISQIEITPEVIAYRDPNRLLELTKASQAQKLTDIDLDLAERRRTEAGAHARRIPFSGRDLQFGGRTKPAWCKPMV